MNWKDIFERMVWTFVQAFAASLVVGAIRTDGVDLLIDAYVAGSAAALSFIKTVAQERIKTLDTRQNI